jgi:selenocysteine lyase/cysteine desulfurase
VSPLEFRRLFPMLERTVHLASCSLGARSSALDEALTEMTEAMGRYGAPWALFEEQAQQTREYLASLLGAATEEIALLPNASTAAYQAASTIDWSKRSHLLTTYAEFPSIAHVWHAQSGRGVQVRFVGERDRAVRAEDYLSAIDDRVGLVSVPLSTYRDATRLPAAEIAAAAHRAGARVFIDAYQAIGTEPVLVGELGCDYLVGGTLKYLLGLPGAAFLYRRATDSDDEPPKLTGWFGRVNPFAFDPSTLDFADSARRFETGTPAVPALYAANAGLRLITNLDLSAVRGHIVAMCRYATERLAADGEAVRAPADPAARGAHVCLLDTTPQQVGDWLADRRIAVSPRGDVVRLSVHYYTSRNDIDTLCEHLREYRRIG